MYATKPFKLPDKLVSIPISEMIISMPSLPEPVTTRLYTHKVGLEITDYRMMNPYLLNLNHIPLELRSHCVEACFKQDYDLIKIKSKKHFNHFKNEVIQHISDLKDYHISGTKILYDKGKGLHNGKYDRNGESFIKLSSKGPNTSLDALLLMNPNLQIDFSPLIGWLKSLENKMIPFKSPKHVTA